LIQCADGMTNRRILKTSVFESVTEFGEQCFVGSGERIHIIVIQTEI